MTLLPEAPDLNEAFGIPEFEQWRQAATAALKGADFERSLYTSTLEGLRIQPLYTPADLPDFSQLQDGRRDVQPGWQMAQEISTREPARYAEALQQDLSQGLTGLSLNLDDFAPENAEALQTALAPLKSAPISLQLYSSQPLAGVLALENSLIAQGLSWTELNGSLFSDGLAQLAQRGKLDTQRHYDHLAESLKFLQQQNSPLRSGIDALVYHEAGAHAVDELACAMSAMVEQVQQLAERGYGPEASLNQISLRLGVGVSFFNELAKFRAARVLFKRIAQAYSCPDAHLQLQVRTSRLWLTRLDPYNNFLRQTVGALAAVLGGADIISTGSYNEGAGPSDDFARRLARNLQLILKDEVKLDFLSDPTGGSYFIETLTSELAEAAWAAFQNIEAEGGLLQALSKGSIQTSIQQTAQRRLELVNKRKQSLIGTNVYANPNEQLTDASTIDNHTEPAIAAVAEVAPLNLTSDLSGGLSADLMISGRKAFAEGASWPSLAQALTGKISHQAEALSPLRLASGFEALHTQAEARQYSVLLLPLGEAKDYRGRVDFCRGYFEAGGIKVKVSDAAQSPEQALAQAEAQSWDALVLCSSDSRYPEYIPELAPQLRSAYPDKALLLAGKPAQAEDYAAAGITQFVRLGDDAQALLAQLLSA